MLSIKFGLRGRLVLLVALVLGAASIGAPARAIVSGTVVTKAPGWMAFVQATRSAGGNPQCSGVLVAADWALTAAHCATELTPYRVGEVYTATVPKAGYVKLPFRTLPAAGIGVALGAARITGATKAHRVSAVELPPGSGYVLTFDKGTVRCPASTQHTCHTIAGIMPEADAALLRLTVPATESPAPLAASVNGPARVYGYGFSSVTQKAIDGLLRTTKGTPYQLSHCTAGNGYVDLCAKRGTSAVYHGDSGGPWLQTQHGRSVVVGITSGGGLSEVYPVDLGRLLAWIRTSTAPTPPPAVHTTAFVLDEQDGAVTPIDTVTNKAGAPIPVGPLPQAITASPDGRTVYVLDTAQNGTVTPIDTATRKARAPISVGTWPSGPLLITPDGRKLYLIADGKIVPVDTAAAKAGTPIPPPVAASTLDAMVLTPNGRTLYVLNHEGDTLIPIDTATDKTGTPLPGVATFNPTSMTMDPTGTKLYISQTCCGIIPVSLPEGAVGQSIQVRDPSSGISFTPNGHTAFLADGNDAAVESFTTATGAVDPIVPTGQQTMRLITTPNGAWVFALGYGGDLIPVDVATRTARAPIPVAATYLATTPDSHTIYVSSTDKDTVTPVDVATDKPGAPIPVGHKPSLILVVP